MTRSEYEARRRALEEQVRADIALIQAAHETRIRSLERLWQAANEADALQAGPIQAAAGPSGAETARPAVPAPPAAEPKTAHPRGQVLADLLDILDQLPEVFERPDIVKLLGYEPSRSSLTRALAKLLDAGKIAVEDYSIGGILASYRRVGAGEGGEG